MSTSSGLVDGMLFPKRDWITTVRDGEPRKLVLCFDGTGNQFSDTNSNVLQFFKCLRKDDASQIVYYQTGIGTYTHPAFLTKPVVEASMALDAAIGWNIENHVQDAYRFLMQNYKPGKPGKPGESGEPADKISLFGFSRGAYTARVLSGFVQKVGLLPPENHAQIPFAWNVFKCSDDEGGIQKCAEYKKAFSLSVEFDFIGVWDTVASLGISGIELPFANSVGGGVRVFRHALALDERRAKFTPNFMLRGNNDLKNEAGVSITPGTQIYTRAEAEAWLARHFREVWFAGCHCDVGGGSVPNNTLNSLARIPLRWMIRECFRMDTGISFDREMLTDIGFGVISEGPGPVVMQGERLSGKDCSLTKRERGKSLYQSLRDSAVVVFLCVPVWRLLLFFYAILVYPLKLLWYSKYSRGLRSAWNRATRSDLEEQRGVAGRLQVNEELSTDTNRLLKEFTEPENEGMAELKDAVSPEYDQLSMNWLWWIFEIWPIMFRVQKSKDKRKEIESRINLGKGRMIYGDAWNRNSGAKFIEVHRSVLTRMETGYRPRAWFRVTRADNGKDTLIRWDDCQVTEERSQIGMIRRHAASSLPPTIRQLLSSQLSHVQSDIEVCGWIKSVRRQKNVSFAVVSDGSSTRGLQTVFRKDVLPDGLNNGCSVKLRGKLVDSPGAKQDREYRVDAAEVIGECDPDTYPIQKQVLTVDYLRDQCHLRARADKIGEMLRIRDCLSRSIHSYFEKEGFTYAHTPIITSSDCEGAGEAFSVSASDTSTQEPLEENEDADSRHFFRKEAYLTVSSQLHLEALVHARSRVYTLSPSFRAERSQTSRHLAEFWMLEAEWAFVRHVEELCVVVEDVIKDVVRAVVARESCEDPEIESRVWETFALNRPWTRMSYTDAVHSLRAAYEGDRSLFAFAPEWGNDLQSEHEKWLAGTTGGPVFVTDYPGSLKSFYMRSNDDGKTIACIYLLVGEKNTSRHRTRDRKHGLLGNKE